MLISLLDSQKCEKLKKLNALTFDASVYLVSSIATFVCGFSIKPIRFAN